MTTKHQVLTQAASNMLIIAPEHLQPVEVAMLPTKALRLIEDQTFAGQCYNNAVKAALALGGGKVVLGATFIHRFGFAVEHAWIELEDGTYYDPTYQLPDDKYRPDRDYTYFSLWSVDIGDYFATSNRLSAGDRDAAIDMLALRTSLETRHLFNYQLGAA